MEIKLKSISLTNFKGIKEFASELNGTTTISGENGTGKSTIFDAFLWLFFGKDSHDQKDFEVKTLNPDGSPIHNLNHEVSACILVDGQEKYFKRVLKEKWVKKRGEETPEMQGHETLFFVNDVPYQAGEYKAQVNAVIPEDVFKLVTSPTYFNSLPWKERRSILTSICGEIPEPEGYDFIKQRAKEIGIDKYKAEISAKKKLLKEELQHIPSRIDELYKSTPEPINEAETLKQIKDREGIIEFVNSQIEEASKRYNHRNSDNLLKQRTLHELKLKLQEIKNRVDYVNRNSETLLKDKIQEAESLRQKTKSAVDSISNDISDKQDLIKIVESEVLGLREKWQKENSKQIVINDSDTLCPACKRPLDDIESKKEQMISSFNNNKVSVLEDINRNGKSKSESIKRMELEIASLKQELSEKKKSLEDVTSTIEKLKSEPIAFRDYTKEPDYIQTEQAISEIKFVEITPEDTTELKEKRDLAQYELSELKQKLTINSIVKKNTERINELKKREGELSQQLADLEKTEFQIEGYTRSLITQVEEKVNSMFSLVRFKMFNTLLNGAIEEACEAMVGGVPYSSNLNSAAKINAGIDIINVLSKHYDITAPVFIDNREGVNKIIPTDSQVINLKVTQDKVLTISNN